MKRMNVVLVAVTTIFAFAGNVAVFSQDHKAPRIEIKEERFDFGKVAPGEQAVHVFEIRNAGNDVLEVQKVQTS
jgi:hypothetical protein